MDNNIKFITRTAVLLALTVAFQGLKLGQFITGPLVNAVLYISTSTVGMLSGVVIGAVTPWVALLVGILKPALAPVVPFIMLGNALLAIVFSLVRPINRYLAIVVASITKFCILYGATKFLLSLKPPIAQAMQFPQLITAVIGGILAIIVLSVLNSIGIAPQLERNKTKIRKL